MATQQPATLARHASTMQRVVERRTVTLYRQALENGDLDPHAPEVEHAIAQQGGGAALSDDIRFQMEHALGVSLARVRIHTDALAADAAAAVRARAFTVGEDIFFASGAFAPETQAGRQLLAHELAHVVQGWEGRTSHSEGVSRTGDPLERDADAVAERALARLDLAPRNVVHEPGRASAATSARSTGSLVLRKPDNDAKAKPSPTNGKEYTTLPDGIDVLPEGKSGWIRIRIAWLVQGGAKIDAKKIALPSSLSVAIMHRLKEAGFWWMPASALANPILSIPGPLDRTKQAVVAGMASSVYELIGLPPGSKFDWILRSDSAMELLQNDQLEMTGVPGESSFAVNVPDSVKVASLRSIFERTKTAIPADLSPAMWGDPRGTWNSEHAAIAFERDGKFLASLLGGDWQKKLAKTPDTDHSKSDGVSFSDAIGPEDRAYFVDWLKRVYGTVPEGAGAPPFPGLVDMLRKIDASGSKDKILDAIKRTSPDGKAIDWKALERLIYDVEEEDYASGVAMKHGGGKAGDEGPARPSEHVTDGAPADARPHKRRFERPITGEIVNQGSLASPGKEMEFVFETEDPMDLGIPWITISWVATPADDPKKHLKSGATRYLAFHPAKGWTVAFEKVGLYRVYAFVDHDQYWPAHFESTEIEVKTEDERLDQVETEAYGDFKDGTNRDAPAESNHFFDVSFTNDRFGADKNTFGRVYKGELPEGFQHRSIQDRVKFLGDDRQKLTDLIKAYKPAAKAGDHTAKDLVDYAEHALETLDESKEKVDKDAKDLKSFEMRGAFLSDKNGVKSGTMTLVALAGKRDQVDTVGIAPMVVAKDKPTVRIHDFSQLYESKNASYTGRGDDFRGAVEAAFVELCKSYPAGRVSVMFEDLDENFKPTGKTLGFELHSNTAWKSFKSVVWDSKVQLAVNLVAAAAAVFVPGLAPVAMLLVTAYNTVDVVDNLQVLINKGQATWKDGVEAAVMIGMNFLPFAGKLTKAGELAGVALFAVDAAATTSNVVVMTEQGMRQVAELRDGDIKEIAKLQSEIAEKKRVNDSDPEIATKQKELDEKIKTAQGRSKEVFEEMAKSGAVMMITPVVFNHMLNGVGKLRTANLEESGLFVHEPNREPYYDPSTRTVRGDRGKITEAKLKAIRERYFLDMYREHAEVGRLLGVPPEQVAIQYKKGQGKVTVERNADGIYEVTAPEGTKPEQIRDEVWAQKEKSPNAPKDRPAVRPAADYGGVMDPEVVANIDGKTIVVGDRIESRAEAEELMQGLAEGDPASIKKLLGGKKPPKNFDPRTTEWGLGRMPDGSYVILRGHHTAVDWAPFPDLVPIGHSHPLRSQKMLKPDGGAVGIRVADLAGNGRINRENRVNFFPSGSDIGFAARQGLPTHAVYTPYVHAGGGMIGNPVGNFAELPRIDFEINNAHRVGSFHGNDDIPIYKADLVARDRNGVVVWKGEAYAVHHPWAGTEIELELPKGWTEQGAGAKPAPHGEGPTTTHARSPERMPKIKTEADARAAKAWQALKDSNTPYEGQYDVQEFFDNYNDGLEFDVEARRWKRPDGKDYSPTTFTKKTGTPAKVYEFLAGKDSTSSFKQFAKMLDENGIATRADIIEKLEKMDLVGARDKDVRHALKEAYKTEIQKRATDPKKSLAEQRDAVERMTSTKDGKSINSKDKGEIVEDWYKHVLETNAKANKEDTKFKAHVEVEDSDFTKPGFKLSEDFDGRQIDIMGDDGIAHEVKSGKEELSTREVAQMQDYNNMVRGALAIDMGGGKTTIVKRVKYTFTSVEGAKANRATMEMALDKYEKRIVFEVISPTGEAEQIDSLAKLNKSKWL